MGIKQNVIKTFWQDFWNQIDEWIVNGEQLIIGGDWNSNVTEASFLKPFRERHLIPVNLTRHGANLPPTHNNGSYANDEIFVSNTLEVKASGFLPHGSNLSDHCPLWLDVTKASFIGVKDKLKPTFATRKLKTNDPRVVNRYLNNLKEFLDNHNLLQRVQRLFSQVQGEMSPAQVQEYKAIDHLKTKAMKEAENIVGS